MTGQVIWITGLSGAGKTTLAKQLYLRLQKNQRRQYYWTGINYDLFSMLIA